eukprot:gene22095-30330_t
MSSSSLNNFGKFIFAGEVSPKDMYQLLTSEWGLGDRLAVTLIDHYGGNIWNVYQALIRLSTEREDFYAVDPFTSSQVIKIEEYDDPIANVISANNIGGVVIKGYVIIGLPKVVWKTTNFSLGIVPSKQSVRLAIAQQLRLNE